MGRRKNSSERPTRKVMMKVEPIIRVLVDESPSVATKVVNPTTNRVIANESPSAATKVVNLTTNRVCADESPFVVIKVVNPTINRVLANESPFVATKVHNPTTNKIHVDESPFATTKVVNPTTNRVLIKESPFAATKVVNPTTNRVLTDESPSITIKVVTPTIDSEGNGGGQTNLQGGSTMPGAKTTRPPSHDHIAQREELRKEKNRKHKQALHVRLATTNDKTKGLVLSTLTSSGSGECSCTFSTKGVRQSIAILAKNYAL
jgi:hypothetical protein